jgi:hypothetical protein
MDCHSAIHLAWNYNYQQQHVLSYSYYTLQRYIICFI